MADDSGGNGNPHSPDLATAIAALADALHAKPQDAAPEPSGLPKLLKDLVPSILPSVVMFALGYIFIQGVELDLKREQFTASTADKLKEYVGALITSDAETSKAELTATALALGGFGGVAAFPLISIIESGGAQRISAAKSGLEQAGRIAPATTCAAISTVIDDATGAYDWRTVKAAAEVAGLVGCRGARRPLERLPEKIEAWAKDDTALDNEWKTDFMKTIDDALARVQAASRRSKSW